MYFWPFRQDREPHTTQDFPIWKTIKLGMCKSPDEYRKALKQARISIGDWGNHILDRISCLQDEIEVNLVVLSVFELGLQLCPAEVGPALRLSYKDQPGGEGSASR
jgi:hypothetical protein